VRHHDPPEVTWLPPKLELGELPELKPLEPELDELEPEFVLVFVELEPELVFVELEPELDEPEPELLADEPVEVDPVDPVEDGVLCVDPGRARASAPAVTTLAMVTAVVADRTLARPSSLAAMARRIASRCALLMYLILR
jgi:hypothetical protein